MDAALTIRPLATDESPPWDLLLLADPSRQRVQEYFAHGLCYVAFLDQALIGEFVLLQTGPQIFELMNVAVAENHQGQGWGKKLVQAAIAQARSLGATTLNVGTGNSSLSQLALYQKCGFRIVGVERDFFMQHDEPEIVENGIRCVDMIRLSMTLAE